MKESQGKEVEVVRACDANTGAGNGSTGEEEREA